ncbi:MAG: FAD-linked oxidase [Candidatus Kapaibacterium sp.]|nr:MAG: FAD-linked oxidase [Candidatus Kapabacteria bacterium]
MTKQRLESWTGVVSPSPVETITLQSTEENPFTHTHASLLARGYGSSYGDICLPTGKAVLCTGLNRIRWFNNQTGIICAEAGVRLGDLVAVTISQGWTLPVLPGTEQVSIGGAIASDIHGKSHHWAGTFGRWVRRVGLIRSDGRIECSPTENAELFGATIGGLGLTGIITWAELQLVPCVSPWMECHDVPFSSLDEYVERSAELERSFDYVVAWCDLSRRGVITGIIHASRFFSSPSAKPEPKRKVPLIEHIPRLPFRLLSRPIVWLASRVRHMVQRPQRIAHYRSVMFPLDGLPWNRLFGPGGFYQLHAVLPPAQRLDAIAALCQHLWQARVALPLCVLKNFSALRSPGLLSFPMEGTSIAVDVPNTPRARQVLETIIADIATIGGRIYPAKDVLLNAEQFQRMYPNWRLLEHYRDRRCSSQFWERVTRQQ